MRDTNRQLPLLIEFLLLVLILSLAAYLRLVNVATTPGWYADEGTFMVIGANLMHGNVEYLAINQSTLLFAKLPLFPLLLAGLFYVGGVEIEILRALSGALGILSVALLYGLVRRAQAERTMALLAALMLAIYPQAVLYARWGFSYNLLTPLVLLMTWGLWEYLETSQPKSLSLSLLAVGIGTVSDLMMLTFVPPLILVVSTRNWRHLIWGLPLLGVPFGLYILIMLLTAPEAFLFDLGFTLFRIGGISWLAQLPLMALNYTNLLSWDYWLIPALIGLFMLKPLRWRRLTLLLFLLPLFSLGRTVGLVGLGAYYLIPLLPFVALGMAALVRYGTPHLLSLVESSLMSLFRAWQWTPAAPSTGQWWQQRAVVWGGALTLFGLVLMPFLISTVSTVRQVQNGFETPVETVLVQPDEAYAVARFINDRVTPDDTIIVSPAIAWLFDSQVTDFQQALAAEGQATVHLPADVPADRFNFDPRYSRARFIVVDNLWRNWAAPNMPEVAAMMEQISQWPLVFEIGDLEVRQNPAR